MGRGAGVEGGGGCGRWGGRGWLRGSAVPAALRRNAAAFLLPMGAAGIAALLPLSTPPLPPRHPPPQHLPTRVRAPPWTSPSPAGQGAKPTGKESGASSLPAPGVRGVSACPRVRVSSPPPPSATAGPRPRVPPAGSAALPPLPPHQVAGREGMSPAACCIALVVPEPRLRGGSLSAAACGFPGRESRVLPPFSKSATCPLLCRGSADFYVLFFFLCVCGFIFGGLGVCVLIL